MKPWIKWVGYFFIFAFLITGIRGCNVEKGLGSNTYGFPFVFMDSDYGDSSYSFYGWGIVKPKIVNFYKDNLVLNLAFWFGIFWLIYHIKDKSVFKKYRGEINYGLFFVILFTLSFFFLVAFDNVSIGFISIPGLYVMIFTGGLLQDWIDKTLPISHFVYESLKSFYPFKDDLPSRVGFIFAALVYFIFGLLLYKFKLYLGFRPQKEIAKRKSSPNSQQPQQANLLFLLFQK